MSPPPGICATQGGDGGENVSVVKSELMGGFSLTGTLGEPKQAAEKLLSTFIAPPESGEYLSVHTPCYRTCVFGILSFAGFGVLVSFVFKMISTSVIRQDFMTGN